MRTIERFVCEICGMEYVYKPFAVACEAHKLGAAPVKVGQKIWAYERYDRPQPDKVVAVKIVPGMLAHAANGWFEADGVKGAEEFLAQKRKDYEWHQWVVVTANAHQHSKDSDSDSTEQPLWFIWPKEYGFPLDGASHMEWIKGGYRDGEP